MTTKKMVAKTLVKILDNPLMKFIMDRRSRIGPVVEEVLEHWSYDLFTRNPGVALFISEDGKTSTETTLDMTCFLNELAKRKAVINLPKYNPRRPGSAKDNQVVLSKENRHGKLLGATSNQSTFSFGVRFKDANVMNLLENDEVGAYRTFLMTDLNGELYDGYQSIEFVPNQKENDWFYNKKIWTDDPNVDGDTIHFNNFISPSKWLAFYGQHYFITKALEMRLVDQIKYMKDLRQKILDSGVHFPLKTGEGAYWRDTSTHYGHFHEEKVWEFECEIDFPDDGSTYQTIEYTRDNLILLDKRIKQLNKDLARLRYAVRSVELAFANKHRDLNSDGTPTTFLLPGWIKADWEEKYRQRGKRKIWNRLKLMQPGVGELSVAIRFRWTEKTEKVRQGRKEDE